MKVSELKAKDMKVLIVCSHRYYAPYTDYMAPFIYEQMQGLKSLGCEFRICFVKGGGIKSYIKAWLDIHKAIKEYQPDIIHAHYGLCGVVANLQRKVPVISTYHGSDINDKNVRRLSMIAVRLSHYNIFVSQKLCDIAGNPINSKVIPCAVDANHFHPMDKQACRKQLGMDADKIYILFSKEFADEVKNYPLAKAAVEGLNYNAELLEFYGYTREQVPLLYNAVDCGLLTSFSEGSPQFVKEAVACGCPVVSTDVGDAKEVIEGVENSYICSYETDDVIRKLQKAFALGHLQETHLDHKYIYENNIKYLFEIYQQICKNL
jgi:glycosyltransferase involved in cell wall biosynthesis